MLYLCLCMLMIIGLGPMVTVTGEVYKVGDAAGWTANSNSNYTDWTSSKTFYINDVLLFEYNATYDNVIQVTHSHFRSCNTSHPLKVFNSGNDSFTIKSRGHFFFTSNFSGHCEGGQKLDVRVLGSSPPVPATPPPRPTTSPSPSPSHKAAAPVKSKAEAPSPTESKAAGRLDVEWFLMSKLGVIFSGLVLLVHGLI